MTIGNTVRALLFRTLPFGVLAFYDWLLFDLRYTTLFNGRDNAVSGFLGFWVPLFVIPAVILIVGGFGVRKIQPHSPFGIPALVMSALLAALNPIVVGCGTLDAIGGMCS